MGFEWQWKDSQVFYITHGKYLILLIVKDRTKFQIFISNSDILLAYFISFRKMDKPITTGQLGLTALVAGNFVGAMCALGFLFWQLALVFTGTTSHELKHGLPAYQVCKNRAIKATGKNSTNTKDVSCNGIWTNFRDIFGPYWYITVIFPIPLPQDGHGLYKQIFPLQNKIMNNRFFKGLSDKGN